MPAAIIVIARLLPKESIKSRGKAKKIKNPIKKTTQKMFSPLVYFSVYFLGMVFLQAGQRVVLRLILCLHSGQMGPEPNINNTSEKAVKYLSI